jgi:DNA processing protein
MSSERIYCLAWSRVNGIGPILLDRLHQHFASLKIAWTANAEALGTIEGCYPKLIDKIIASRAKIDPEKLFAEHETNNPCWWTRRDDEYPRLLQEIPTAPGVLYYRGQVVAAENQGQIPTIGIVGTRDPSDYGKKWARKIGGFLASKGFTIASGLAQGVDTEAHSGCLEAGGRTIAVVGTGVDIVYPARNQALANTIEQHGLIVSEYVGGTTPDRPHFPARNRIIAGLSRVVIVIEAPVRSGALITAHQANDFNRDVYILPGSIDNPNSIGCLGLLSRGAQPILSLEHLAELLASIPQIDPPAQQLQLFDPPPPVIPLPDLAPDIQQVWLLVTTEPCSFDSIIDRSNLPISIVSSALLQLELLGLVTQLPGMRYQR